MDYANVMKQPVNKQAIADLVKLKDEFNTVVESLELMNDEEFMTSYHKAKEQVKKREFGDWHLPEHHFSFYSAKSTGQCCAKHKY